MSWSQNDQYCNIKSIYPLGGRSSICKRLELFFQLCMETGTFTSEGIKAKVLPVHKKNDKQQIKNYRSIFLLPISCKGFGRLFYNKLV